jgi:hypothetical protein
MGLQEMVPEFEFAESAPNRQLQNEVENIEEQDSR